MINIRPIILGIDLIALCSLLSNSSSEYSLSIIAKIFWKNETNFPQINKKTVIWTMSAKRIIKIFEFAQLTWKVNTSQKSIGVITEL